MTYMQTIMEHEDMAYDKGMSQGISQGISQANKAVICISARRVLLK